MLTIKPIMDSDAEDVLAFKTCCGLKMEDQNLEIHLTNNSKEEIVANSAFELIGNSGVTRIENATPHGELPVPPDTTIALYCYMDEQLWQKCHTIVFTDTTGNRYKAKLEHKTNPGS